MAKNKKQAHAQFIFITIFLDMVGIGLIIPILPDLIRRLSADVNSVSQYYGYMISSYALIQFFASPVLGALSDQFGRRKVLLVSLLGASVDYIIMAFAPSFSILFIGRIISGLTGASITVASAYMADVSDDTNRSSNFGLIGAAFGLGFIAGPALGGLIGSYGHQYPFLAAACLNLLNFSFGLFVLPESLPENMRRKINFKKINPLQSIWHALKNSSSILLIWIYILVVLSGQVHPSVWVLYTQLKFQWTTFDIGISLASVGLATAIVQGGLTRWINPKIGDWNALLVGLIISALAYFGFALVNTGWLMYAVLIPSCLAGIAGPAIQSLVSAKTPKEEQGELQGTLMGLSSLVAVIGPLFYTGIFSHYTKVGARIYFPGAPYISAGVICFMAIIIFYFVKQPAVDRSKVL